jgi:hypothetical protein
MPSLIDSILRVMRGSRSRSVGVCAVCRRPVREDDERFDLRRGTRVHRACATYRMRAEQAGGRASRVSARRHALHVGD